MKQVLLLLIILGSLSVATPSLAQTFKLQDEIAAYNQGNYQHVISIGLILTKQNPYDPRPHYYLANAYVHLGQNKDAIEEYSFCDKITEDPQLKSYCDQALNDLLSRSNKTNHFSLYGSRVITNAQANRSVIQAAHDAQVAQQAQAVQAAQDAQAARLTQLMPSMPPHPSSNQTVQEQIRSIDDWYRETRRAIPRGIADYKTTVENLRQIRKERITQVQASGRTSLNQAGGQPAIAYPSIPNPNAPYPNAAPYVPFQNPQAVMPNIPTATLPIFNSKQSDPYAKLFDHAPLPPPPFPASAIKGAQKALQQKVN